MSASAYQLAAQARLREHFADVHVEWSVVKDATDALRADIHHYAPRVDIAIGPFNTTPGPDPAISEDLPAAFRNLFSALPANPNPLGV